MPTVSPDDLLTLSAIEKWKQCATETVDYIGAGIAMQAIPALFETQTIALVAIIGTQFPKLDPAPIQDVFAAVWAWVEDRNTSHIPPHPILYATLQRAIQVLAAVEAVAMKVDTPTDTADGGKADAAGVWLARAMLLVRDNPEWSDAKIVREVGRHNSRLTRSREYKIAAALARGQRTPDEGTATINPVTKNRTLDAIHDREDFQEEIDTRLDRETKNRNATRNANPRNTQ